MAECSRHPGNMLPGCFYCRNGLEPPQDNRGTAEDLYQDLRKLRKAGADLSQFPIEMAIGDSTVAWNGVLALHPDSLVLDS